MRVNEDLRRAMGAKGVRQYQVAQALGIWESSLARILRTEIPIDKKKKILQVIDEIAEAADTEASRVIDNITGTEALQIMDEITKEVDNE